MPGGTIAHRAGVCVNKAELRPVPERLLEVVSDDLLEFRHPGRGDLEEPVGEALVHASPRPLKQPVIGGIPHEKVTELVALTTKSRAAGPDEALAAQCRQRRREVGARVPVRCQRRDGGGLELQADHRCPLDDAPLERDQPVEP